MNISDLKIGMEINNDSLAEIFKCSTQGGMRKSNTHNTLTIISNHVKSVYDDRWVKNILHYTGMGLTGNQRLDFNQNKTLTNIQSNDVEAHLFEVFVEKIYTYRGKITLDSAPYSEEQIDNNNELRKVWIFPLRVINDEEIIIDKNKLDEIFLKKENNARRLTNEKLESFAKSAKGKVGKRKSFFNYYERNVYVSEFAQRRAAGFCQLCNEPAPFLRKDNSPFLETHHVIWLSNGGDDNIENVVALCHNCHRELHILNQSEDIEFLQSITY